MNIDSIEEWQKAETLVQWAYDDNVACYIVTYEDDVERNVPVTDVTMMVVDDHEGLCWYECWLMTHEHRPVRYVEGLLFINKSNGEELYFDTYEVTKSVHGKHVGYELLTETHKYK